MTAVVGPVPVVRFRGGAVVPYEAPKSTMDPRWKACADHHVACDCREAELAEQIAELKSELELARAVTRRVLAGHPTEVEEVAPDGTLREVGCACTGCQIAREVGLLIGVADSAARDEVYGLTSWQEEFEQRWKVCHSGTHKQHPDVCQWAITRNRGHFHEHLTNPDGTPVRREPDEIVAPF